MRGSGLTVPTQGLAVAERRLFPEAEALVRLGSRWGCKKEGLEPVLINMKIH